MTRSSRPLPLRAELVRSMAPATDRAISPLKQWRSRRNVVIYIAYRNGISQRVLADVFDLPRSRIATIVKGLDARLGGGEAPPPRG